MGEKEEIYSARKKIKFLNSKFIIRDSEPTTFLFSFRFFASNKYEIPYFCQFLKICIFWIFFNLLKNYLFPMIKWSVGSINVEESVA